MSYLDSYWTTDDAGKERRVLGGLGLLRVQRDEGGYALARSGVNLGQTLDRSAHDEA